MFPFQRLYDYVNKQWEEEIVPSLAEYIKIPNKSPHFDKNWKQNGYMDQAVQHLAAWCRAHALPGMQVEILESSGRTPLLFLEIPGQGESSVLFYGHLDKQPEFSGWNEGLDPWTPVVQEGRLYGRGAADDGYSLYAALTALRALHEQALPIPPSMILIEACEESGSEDLPYYMDLLKDRIKTPFLVLGLDSGAGNYEQLWMTTSLRGNIVGTLSLALLSEGVHSGNASGVVADGFRVARELIARIEDERTGAIKLPELYCKIPDERVQQALQCAEILGKEVYEQFPLYPGVKPLDDNLQELILNRTWRPALTITGAEGLPSLEDAGNVLRSSTSLKLSLRLPPLVAAGSAASLVQKTLTEGPLYHAQVDFQIESASQGWNAPPSSPWLNQLVDEASQAFYHKPAAYMGEGGTIPFMSMLGAQFPQAQFIVTGVLGPKSNAHGPNEFLHLDMVKKLTACLSYILYSCSQQK